MRPRLAALVVLITNGVVWSAETTAPPVDSVDSISAARRDFDAVKAIRDKALLPKDHLPQMSVPELQVGDSEFVLSQRRKKEELEREAKMKKKSSNWLIEAMAESDPRKESSSKAGEKADELARLLTGSKEETKINVPAVQSRATDEKETRKPDLPPNPLNSFLTDWMTPQDYALLKPGLQSSGASTAALPASENAATGPALTVSIDLPGAKNDALSTLLAPEHGVLLPAKPADNPYLQGLNEPAPFAALTPPPNLPPVALTPPPLATGPSIFSPAPAPPPPAPASKLPDFIKPVGDDRYFKPLKRF